MIIEFMAEGDYWDKLVLSCRLQIFRCPNNYMAPWLQLCPDKESNFWPNIRILPMIDKLKTPFWAKAFIRYLFGQRNRVQGWNSISPFVLYFSNFRSEAALLQFTRFSKWLSTNSTLFKHQVMNVLKQLGGSSHFNGWENQMFIGVRRAPSTSTTVYQHQLLNFTVRKNLIAV